MTLAEFAVTLFCVAAWAATALPPDRPASAAERSTALSWFFMGFLTSFGDGAEFHRGRWGKQDDVSGCGTARIRPPRRVSGTHPLSACARKGYREKRAAE